MDASSGPPNQDDASAGFAQPGSAQDLARQMAEKSDQELFAVLASPADWRPEAIEAAKAEAQKRTYEIAPAPAAVPPPIGNASQVRPGAMCVQHPQVQAAQQCTFCGAFMCPTCDFSFPNNLHLCPVCASKTEDGLSPRRKKYLIASFVLAVWTTFGMACLVSGALRGMASNQGETVLLGYALLLFVLSPGITGLTLGLNAKHARQANPPAIWIAITWNAVLVASFAILTLVGLMKK